MLVEPGSFISRTSAHSSGDHLEFSSALEEVVVVERNFQNPLQDSGSWKIQNGKEIFPTLPSQASWRRAARRNPGISQESLVVESEER